MSASASTQLTPQAAAEDFLPLKGTDHVEFYVGNARQAAYFYRTAFGMSLVAYAGPETGQRDRASYVVQQGKIRFVLTTALRSGNPIADHVARHGDAVRVVALWVDDARAAWRETTSRGAISAAEPSVLTD
jgi:4-hydroxyphenylpyruvate dioxygenase